jgi:hypothetical protein
MNPDTFENKQQKDPLSNVYHWLQSTTSIHIPEAESLLDLLYCFAPVYKNPLIISANSAIPPDSQLHLEFMHSYSIMNS